jgi:hypothetical protein
MKDLTHPTLDKTFSNASSTEKDACAFAAQLDSLGMTIQRARDVACLFTYLSQESLNSSSKHIELDRQALRGVMERICGDLDEALHSLDTVQDLFSLVAKKSDL